MLRLTRARVVLDELLRPDYAGVVSCDRAKMYYSQPRLQWCWAHLKRDFQALIDSGDGVKKRLGHDLMRPTRKLFELWARYRDGTLTRVGFQRLMKPVREEIEALLLRGAFAGVGMAEELSNHRDWLWTFVDVAGVEPTNNASERALRHAVIWRKLSFGTQSAAGSRFDGAFVRGLSGENCSTRLEEAASRNATQHPQSVTCDRLRTVHGAGGVLASAR